MSLTDTTRIQLFKTILNIHHGDFDRVKEFPAGRLPFLYLPFDGQKRNLM